MTTYTFADRYREAGLEPTDEKIRSREEPVKRIVKNIRNENIVALTLFYFGRTDIDLLWFRDEFVKEDASFSMVNNENEARVLAALVLSQLFSANNSFAILAVSVGSVRGLRVPQQSAWLVYDAEEAFIKRSVANRIPGDIKSSFTPTVNEELAAELAEAAETLELATIVSLLTQVREEALQSATATSKQLSQAMKECHRQLALMREESQMLWWLTSGYSKILSRPFASLLPGQAAIAGALDLSILTKFTHLGPVAIPAMLDKIIALGRKSKAQPLGSISALIDSFPSEDIAKLNVSTDLDSFISPISCAIALAHITGSGAWHSRFKVQTGLDSSLLLTPVLMAEQLYREQLLGQLL